MFAMLVDDSFEIPEKGIIVTGKVNTKKYSIKEFDCLYDFYGNQFWVKETEHFLNYEHRNSENENMTFLIEAHEKNKDYFKNKLLTSKFKMGFIYAADKFDSLVPDLGYKEEHDLFSEDGYKTYLADIERFELDGEIDLPPTDIIQRIIYRGKRLSPELYRRLYNAMAEQDYYLVNSPDQYENIDRLSVNCPELVGYMPIKSDTKAYKEEEFHIFYLNGEIVKEYDKANDEDIILKLSNEERNNLLSIAENINSNFITFFLKRRKDGSLIISGICDGQISEVPFFPFKKLINILVSTIYYCKSDGQLRPTAVDEDWKLENITAFKTPVGNIIVVDEENNRIPITVTMVSDCPLEVYADDRERIRYHIYPTDNYYIRVLAENLDIGKKYRAIFTGETLEYGGGDENTECLSRIIGSYSFAFGAYFPNFYYEISGYSPEEYITDFLDDNSGFKFELIDKSNDVCFEISWLKNNDEPDECLQACESWVT